MGIYSRGRGDGPSARSSHLCAHLSSAAIRTQARDLAAQFPQTGEHEVDTI